MWREWSSLLRCYTKRPESQHGAFSRSIIPAVTFEQALEHPHVKSRIFNPDALVIEVDQFTNAQRLDEFVDGLPMVNRMLRPLMTFDHIMIDGHSRRVLRFPGTVLHEDDHQEPRLRSIGIPYAGLSDLKKDHIIRWKSVIEEIREDPRDPKSGAFSLQAPILIDPLDLLPYE